MRAKHTEGQAPAEILGRVFEILYKFPTKPYHNWTEGLRVEAKIGWTKLKARQQDFLKCNR